MTQISTKDDDSGSTTTVRSVAEPSRDRATGHDMAPAEPGTANPSPPGLIGTAGKVGPAGQVVERGRAARAGMGVLLGLVAAAVAAILLAPVALSSRDLLDWAAAPTGLGLPGQWPVLVILSLDAAAIACVLMSILCTWRGEKPGIFGVLVWVFATTSAFANWRHGMAPGAAPDRVWFIPLMSLTGPGVLEVVLHRVRAWIHHDQTPPALTALTETGQGGQPETGLSWLRWVPGLGAFGDTFGAYRTRLLIPGISSFATAVAEFHRLSPDGSVRVAAALRRRRQAEAQAELLTTLNPPLPAITSGSGKGLPVDLMKRIPVQPGAYQHWRDVWADLQTLDLNAQQGTNEHTEGDGQQVGAKLQTLASRHRMSTRQLQFVRRAGEAGLLNSPIPPAVLMAQELTRTTTDKQTPANNSSGRSTTVALNGHVRS